MTCDGPAVQLQGVTKWFGEHTALERVDLRVERGTVHGLVGTNGAGKSTLLSILLGLVRPDEGELWLFGRTRREAGAAWLDGVGGFVESPRFYPYLTGRANLAVLAGLDGGDAAALIDPALDLVGLADARRLKVKGYSLGMRQRLALAAAVIRRPALLVLDEPTNGLDPGGNRGLRDALQVVVERGATVLFSSHDVGQVEQLSHDVTVLDHGAVVFSGSARQLQDETPLRVWQLRTSDDDMARRCGGAGVEMDRGAGSLRVSADQAGLGRLLLALADARVTVRALEQVESPLETLLLRLAGRVDVDQPNAEASTAGVLA